MNLKILYKQYKGNISNEVNKITLNLDNNIYTINIIYIPNLKRNAFIDTRYDKDDREKLYDYVSKAYPNITQLEFENYLLWKIYKYSKCKGLNEPEHIDLLNVTPIF